MSATQQMNAMTSSVNYATKAANGLKVAGNNMNSGAKNLANNRVAAANGNATVATNALTGAAKNLEKSANSLTPFVNLNRNVEVAQKYLRRAVAETVKVNTAKALALMGEAVARLATPQATPINNNNRRLNNIKSKL